MRFRRSHVPYVCLALALGLGRAQGALAQDDDDTSGEAAPDEVPRTRVAALIVTTGQLDPEMANDLTEVLIGALAARGRLTIVGKEEFQAQLGQGDEGTLECISSMTCIGRVGVQLDVSEVIAGTLAQRMERWVFNLNRVDVRTGQLVGRVFREIEGDLGAVADAVNAAIPELYEARPSAPLDPPLPAAPDPATLVLATSVVGAEVLLDGVLVGHTVHGGGLRHEAAPGAVEVSVRAPGYRSWRRRVRLREGRELRVEVGLQEDVVESMQPWLFIGAGLAIVTAAAGIAFGISSQEVLSFTEEQLASGAVTRAEMVAYYDARRDEAIAANVLFGVAGALAISAAVMLVFPVRERVGGVALVPSPGGLELRGAF